MNMSPYERARQVYQQEPCARTFEQDVELHHRHGFVFSTPQFFIMGRPVPSKAAPNALVNPEFTYDRNDCDCWHIYLAAGDLSKAWDIMPWPMPWFSFERRNELRFYPADRIRRLSTGEGLTMP